MRVIKAFHTSIRPNHGLYNDILAPQNARKAETKQKPKIGVSIPFQRPVRLLHESQHLRGTFSTGLVLGPRGEQNEVHKANFKDK